MTKKLENVHCSNCGKCCSGTDPELGLVVRAWVECPECLEKSERNSAKFDDRCALLRAALVGLVGYDTRAELEQLEAAMRLMPAPAHDKAVTIDAIHALLATLS